MATKKFKAVVVDTETTGLLLPIMMPLDQQPRIIEIGIAVVVNGKSKTEYNCLIDPQCQIPELITKITGLKDEDVAGQKKFHEIVDDIEELFKGADFFIAHNANFDQGMIRTELQRCNREANFPWPREIICSVQEYVYLFGYRPKLPLLYEHLLGKPLAQTHRAIDDVRALIECLVKDDFFKRIAA